jgi:hypothetical protein
VSPVLDHWHARMMPDRGAGRPSDGAPVRCARLQRSVQGRVHGVRDFTRSTPEPASRHQRLPGVGFSGCRSGSCCLGPRGRDAVF